MTYYVILIFSLSILLFSCSGEEAHSGIPDTDADSGQEISNQLYSIINESSALSAEDYIVLKTHLEESRIIFFSGNIILNSEENSSEEDIENLAIARQAYAKFGRDLPLPDNTKIFVQDEGDLKAIYFDNHIPATSEVSDETNYLPSSAFGGAYNWKFLFDPSSGEIVLALMGG